jgi:hypothetical protein
VVGGAHIAEVRNAYKISVGKTEWIPPVRHKPRWGDNIKIDLL